MKICNVAMERLLTRVYRKGIVPYSSKRIWKQKTLDGNPFWGIGDFCGVSVDGVIKYGRELTDLEWEGNELFFSHEDQRYLENEVIAAYLALKKQLEEEFSDWIFDLVVSIDEENHTGSIRFYNIRDGYHYIEPTQENLDGFQMEAVLVETVNEVHLENYIPLLEEQLVNVPAEIQPVTECEIRIQDLTSESHIHISWNDEEFTMYFDSFHCHYGADEWDSLVDDVRNIIAGRLVAGRAESSGRWLGSYLLEQGNIPVASKSRLLKYLFGGQKDFYKEVQRNGGTFSVTAWNAEKNRIYLLREKGIYEIIRLIDKPEIKGQAAQWFHEKWNIPFAAYIESMEDCLTKRNQVPQWYVAMEGNRIVGGLGVIENDFHDRKDLSPNVCAVYVEEDKRCNGIAGALLNVVCEDMKRAGIDPLYLVTDHSSFYERYGWEFLCMVQGDGEPGMTRMYIHRG